MLVDPFKNFGSDWALVSAGSKEDFNTMTVAWGAMGTLWSRPCVTVYVKPCRYTYNYLNNSEYFTVSFYDEKYRDDLKILGTKSKRDGDKVSLTKLTPDYLENSVSFKEAKMTIVCKKIYYQDLDLNNMPQDIIDHYYSVEEPHRIYIGQVVDIINN